MRGRSASVQTATGSTPGAEIVTIPQLEPVACITAFRHLHSARVAADPNIPIFPVLNIADLRDPQMYPPGLPLAYPSSGSGGPGGPVSIFYQFVMRGDNRFTVVWHNTTGALPEGCAIDRCWSPAVGKTLFDTVESTIAILRPNRSATGPMRRSPTASPIKLAEKIGARAGRESFQSFARAGPR